MAGKMRKAVRATGRGFRAVGRGIVHAAKVVSDRQLSKKKIEWAKKGMIKTSLDGLSERRIEMFNGLPVLVQHLVRPRKGVLGFSKYFFYDAQGRLVRKRVVNGSKLREYEYSPPGRFKGKRVKKE